LIASAALLLALFIADRSNGLERMQSRAWLKDQQLWIESFASGLRTVDSWVGLGTTVGTQGAIVVLGAVLGTIVVLHPSEGWPTTMRKALFLMIGCLIGGFLLDSAYGINKIQATPTWALWSAAATIALWIIIASIVDWRGWKFGWKATALVGTNPLLAYLLHPILLFVLEVTRFDLYGMWPQVTSFSEVFRSAAVAIGIGLVTAGITNLGWRLKL
jgi:heparan-alpha-glucosaminide N-acetyltransferase